MEGDRVAMKKADKPVEPVVESVAASEAVAEVQVIPKTRVRALTETVDYKTGINYKAGDIFEIERTEAELIIAIAHGLIRVLDDSTEEEPNV